MHHPETEKLKKKKKVNFLVQCHSKWKVSDLSKKEWKLPAIWGDYTRELNSICPQTTKEKNIFFFFFFISGFWD